jgi:hypothetical protein
VDLLGRVEEFLRLQRATTTQVTLPPLVCAVLGWGDIGHSLNPTRYSYDLRFGLGNVGASGLPARAASWRRVDRATSATDRNPELKDGAPIARHSQRCIGLRPRSFRRPWLAIALVLLHHKILCRECLAIGAEQHGHRGRVLTRAAIRRRRMVAIELGIWRSGRSGGAAGSVTIG